MYGKTVMGKETNMLQLEEKMKANDIVQLLDGNLEIFNKEKLLRLKRLG